MKPFAIFLTFLVGAFFGKCTGQYWEYEKYSIPLRDQISCGRDPSLLEDPDRKCLGTYGKFPALYCYVTPANFTEPHSKYYRALRAEHARNCQGWTPRVRACALRFAEKSTNVCQRKGAIEVASFKLWIALQNQFCADPGAGNLIRFLSSGGFKCVEIGRPGSNNGYETFSSCMRESNLDNFLDYKLYLSGEGGKTCLLGALEKCPRAKRLGTEIYIKILNEVRKID